MEQRRGAAQLPVESRPAGFARSTAFLSGKGGVGKTSLALNFAIALAREGRRVCLWDVSGLANYDLLCGASGYWDISHVLTGARRVAEVLLEGPASISILPGMHHWNPVRSDSSPHAAAIRQDLEQIESECDEIILDLPSGTSRPAESWAHAASKTVLVTTPEPTSIADTYATVKSLFRSGDAELSVLVNQVNSADQAFDVIDRLQQTSRLFLHRELKAAGFVPADPSVPRAVLRRQPFLLESPHSPAAEAIRGLAQRTAAVSPPSTQQSLVARLHDYMSVPASSSSG